MQTAEKTLSEQLKIHPWQLEVRGQIIMARKSGGKWPYGTKHYLYSIQRVGFGPSETFYFEYSQGPAHTKAPSLADLVWCLLLDASIAQDYDDEWEMAKNLGYELDSKESYKAALAAYEACEEVNDWLTDTFSSEELDQLYVMFEDY